MAGWDWGVWSPCGPSHLPCFQEVLIDFSADVAGTGLGLAVKVGG
jgi:hypothetical protein